MECKLLMMATSNIFSPSSGKPILTPSQDIVLGAYYLTIEPRKKPAKGERVPLLSGLQEVLYVKADGALKFHSWVEVPNPDFGRETVYGDSKRRTLRTTVGRVIFNEIWPKALGFVNFPVPKGKLGDLILNTYKTSGNHITVETLDRLKELGFQTAFQAGISIGIDDMIIPDSKKEIVAESRKKITEVEAQFHKGIITDGERYNKVVDIWTGATDQIAKQVFAKLENNEGRTEVNPVYIMMDSGARGNKQQVRQLCGTRGLMAKPSGEIIERPILSSFREGLTVLEYFISTHGARKGLADTALKTADAGYLTRKLCDVAMDVIIAEEDCGSRDGVWKKAIFEGDDEIVGLKERIIGRFSSDDVINPINPSEILVGAGELITEESAARIDELGIERVKVMSPLTSTAKGGIDAKSYGINPATNKVAKIGDSVGIIAAQSIGEPGTQLTMRTFHIGGIAQGGQQSFQEAAQPGRIEFRNPNVLANEAGDQIVMGRNMQIAIIDDNGIERASYKITYGTKVFVTEGTQVARGDKLYEWDPYTLPIIAEKSGVSKFVDLVAGLSVRDETDEATGMTQKVVTDWRSVPRGGDLKPEIILMDPETGEPLRNDAGNPITYPMSVDAILSVEDGEPVKAGDVVARIPREGARTKDITGGLPRVAELFEARRPKDHAIICEIDGYVRFGKDYKNKRRITIEPVDETMQTVEYMVPKGKHIPVQEGDFVQKGDNIMDGNPAPHDILRIMGIEALANYLIDEVQDVYRLQGVKINDKHIEVIVRQMLQKWEILDSGETTLLKGEHVDKAELEEMNDKAIADGRRPAQAEPILLGITKASLQTRSFISAASFQETTRVLTEASVQGKRDKLVGLKENVIVGRLIPAGTGGATTRVEKIATDRDAKVLEARRAEAEAAAALAAPEVTFADATDGADD